MPHKKRASEKPSRATKAKRTAKQPRPKKKGELPVEQAAQSELPDEGQLEPSLRDEDERD